MEKKVSVLMTVYNDADRFLSKSINSILNQTYLNIEFVIVNDGSSDDSAKIIQKFQKIDNRIVFINRKENKGRVYSLNEGLSKCIGKFVFINDADDISLLARIKECVHFYETRVSNKDGFGLLGTAYIMNDISKNKKVEYKLKYGSIIKKRIPMWRLLIGMPFPHSSVMYSSNALRSVGGFPKEVTSSIDYFALLKIASKYDIFGLDTVLMERNIDNNNYFMTKSLTYRNEENMKVVRQWSRKNIKFHIIKNIPNIIRNVIMKSK